MSDLIERQIQRLRDVTQWAEERTILRDVRAWERSVAEAIALIPAPVVVTVDADEWD